MLDSNASASTLNIIFLSLLSLTETGEVRAITGIRFCWHKKTGRQHTVPPAGVYFK